MSRADDPLDDQPRRLTHVIYNAALGHVRVRAEDSLATTIEVPPGEVRFRRVVGAVEPEMALWLDSAERDYLGRMLEHVLHALKITPEARAALEAVRAKLAEVGPPPIVANEGDAGTSAAAPTPILEDVAPVPARAAVAEAGASAAPGAAPATTTRRQAQGARGRGANAPAARATASASRPAPPSRGATPPPPPVAAAAAEPSPPVETVAPEPAPRAAPVEPAPVEAPPSREPVRAVSDATPRPAPEPAVSTDGWGEEPTFDLVWRDLQALRDRGPVLHTLAGQASSEIREVAADGVWLYSHGLGREYLIGRDLLEVAWAALAQNGVLVPRELRGAMSYGAATLLAHLPYVDYSADPITLYFPAKAPHPLGTVSRRDL